MIDRRTIFVPLFLLLAVCGRSVFGYQVRPGEVSCIVPSNAELAAKPALEHEKNIRGIVFRLELPKAKYLPGEVIWGKFSVIHPGKIRTVIMSPPWHGNYVSTLDLILRTQAESTDDKDANGGVSAWNQPIVYYGHDKLDMGRPHLACHEMIEIGPGETFTAWVPINVVQGNNTVSQFGRGMLSNWIPGFGFPKPGKYQFFVRYWDSSNSFPEGWPEHVPLDDFLTPEGVKKQKQFRQKRHDAIMHETDGFMQIFSSQWLGDQSYTTFGPFEVELIPPSSLELRAKEQVAALEKMLADWQVNQGIREPLIDYLHGFQKRDVAELPEILQGKMLDSVLADALSFTLIRHHFSIEREERKPAKFVPLKLEDIDHLLDRLMQNDPLRTHVVLAKCIWLHEHDQRAEAIKLADSIRATNPDAEVFWHLSQYGKWTEKDRDRPQKPN